MTHISVCLWFDSQAEEAAKFYTTLFKNSKILGRATYTESSSQASGQKKDSLMTIAFEVEGQKILGLNGGPHFKFSAAHSFMVWCDSQQEIEKYWAALSDGGKIRIRLDKYPWAEAYGWTADKFGVQWQVILSKTKQKIAPAFLFVDELLGRGQEAIDFYLSVFKTSKVELMAKDPDTKQILHGLFSIGENSFVLMEGEGKHNLKFNNAFSLVINCNDQDEIDYYWAALSKGGSAEPCGWLKDKFGVSWQVVPQQLGFWMSDAEKSEKLMQEIMTMTKIDMNALEKIFQS